MAAYTAPLRDMTLSMNLAGMDTIAALPGYEDASPDLVAAVLEEAGRFGAQELAPLNIASDREGSVLENGVVRTYSGLKAFYGQFVEAGWNAVPFDPTYGGQGLPWLVASAVQEIWQSANCAFALCPMLSQGAVESLSSHGSDAQKALYLPKMISGEWTGTMNLTEPQAGSDLARVRTKAVRASDHYLITGQKIFITYGDHDLTENIIHMVLARLPDAPEGVKGISLFIVPKVMVNADGSLGDRNDVRCVSLEHKLGIHGSPTAVMAFGDDGGAIGYLVGEENRGLEYMFTMMNNARLQVGLQGVAVAERALQQAVAYAKDRVQSRPVSGGRDPVAIIEHPDVRRMLMTAKALTEASRHLAYTAVAALDISHKSPDPAAAAAAEARVALLTPVVKAWSTDIGVRVADLGVQVHGGVGYIEETGAAQHYRDARIAPIYEGTNGIQAADLMGRKVQRDKGAEMTRLLAEMRSGLAALPSDQAAALAAACDRLERVTAWALTANAVDSAAAATPFLRLTGLTVGGWLMAAAAALAAKGEDAAFAADKAATAAFFLRHLLPETASLEADVMAGGDAVMALAVDRF
ncbi:MAG: acyl-CoA dehydrogenase family protein [Rhodospirillaceae bacterium]